MKIDREKHVWEGWTVGSFIDSLSPEIEMIMNRMSWKDPFKTKEEVKNIVWRISHITKNTFLKWWIILQLNTISNES